MRHRVAGRKLSRTSAHRKALLRGLLRSLVAQFPEKGFIVTTREKAKFCQPKAERLVTMARNKTVPNIRRAMALLQDRELVGVLFDRIGPYYSERPGGYTRVVRLASQRLGDNASLAYFGFVKGEQSEEEEPAPSEA